MLRCNPTRYVSAHGALGQGPLQVSPGAAVGAGVFLAAASLVPLAVTGYVAKRYDSVPKGVGAGLVTTIGLNLIAAGVSGS